MFSFLRGYFSTDLAIDLGTANTLIYVRGQGIVLQPSFLVGPDLLAGTLVEVMPAWRSRSLRQKASIRSRWWRQTG